MVDQIVSWGIVEAMFKSKQEIIKFKIFMRGKKQPPGNKVYMEDVLVFLGGERE